MASEQKDAQKYRVSGASSFIDKMMNWMLDNMDLKYDQQKRMQEGFADCSSFVFRAGRAAGKEEWSNQRTAPTSSQEVYDADYELLWPGDYASIGREYGGESLVKQDREKGILLFFNTISSTSRKNEITHVATSLGDGNMIQTANKQSNVEIVPDTKYKRVCAVIRYNLKAPLRLGHKGARVRQLQLELNGLGAGLTVDGEYGAKTEAAVQKYKGGQEAPAGEMQAIVTGGSVNVRKGPGTGYAIQATAHKGDHLVLEPAVSGWNRILAGMAGGQDVSGFYISATYVKEA